MKHINKILIFLIGIFLLTLVSCNKIENEVKIIVPNGTPFLAIADLIEEENITIDNVEGALVLRGALVDNSYDIVIAPLNLGTQLYTLGNSKYVLDSVIAFGNTYIVSKKGVKLDSIQDLENKTILAYSKGGVPDLLLQHVLQDNEVNANIEYQNALSDVVPFFINNNYDYILAAEPIISKLEIQRELELNILDLQDLILDIEILQAAIFVNPESDKQSDIDKVINKIKDSIKRMNDNPKQYANDSLDLDVFFSDLTKEVIEACIPKSNIGFMKAKDNQEAIEKYLSLLHYELPKDGFYR